MACTDYKVSKDRIPPDDPDPVAILDKVVVAIDCRVVIDEDGNVVVYDPTD